ncbi:MAG: ATP-binding protein [Bacteroidota bacterium]
MKEILNNALKHSKASKIDLSISFNKNLLELIIADNGQGFETEKVYAGNGMNTMRKRFESSNGKVVISSHNGKGTSVSLAIELL